MEAKYIKQVRQTNQLEPRLSGRTFFETLFCSLAGGFYPVYFTSLGLIFAGMFYLWLIPESVEKATKISDSNNNKGDEEKQINVVSKAWRSFNQTNRLFCHTLRYVFR